MSEEYDLGKSESKIGQLYPILVDKDGEILDGFHREEANPEWKRLKLEHIDTEEKKLIARLVANFHRRKVSREEKTEWINGLAEIYKKQGHKVRGDEHGNPNEIIGKIGEVTGLSKWTIGQYLKASFRQTEKSAEKHPPRTTASQAIESKVGGDYGKQLVERHREEVKQELKRDPQFQREVIEEIRKPQLDSSKAECAVLPPIEDETELAPIKTESTTKIVCPYCGRDFNIGEAEIL